MDNINFKKVLDDEELFNQQANYEDNFEKINQLVVPKITDLETNKVDKTYVDDQDAALTAQLAEKANRVQASWITPTLINGATGSLMYRKNQFDELQLKGTLSSVGSTNFGTVCQLPTGYRPLAFKYVGVYDSGSVYVAPNGLIYCRSNKTGNTTVYFDGISIPLD